jgi:hypothetical protein
VSTPLEQWWQATLMSIIELGIVINFAALFMSTCAQRHMRWWIAEFESPWARVPIIVGGVTGDCGHEPQVSRRLATRDCGYLCMPAVSSLLSVFAGVLYLGIFTRFIAGTSGTYQQDYRTAGGYLTAIAGALALAAGFYKSWSQWIVCPVEHVWHCDCHLDWAQTEHDLKERRLASTPHAEPHQGLPQLLLETRELLVWLMHHLLDPCRYVLRPVLHSAARVARIIATIPPERTPGPFDPPPKHPDWHYEHEERVRAREEFERIRREKEEAFKSPFKSLRRSFIMKPSLAGKGVSANAQRRIAEAALASYALSRAEAEAAAATDALSKARIAREDANHARLAVEKAKRAARAKNDAALAELEGKAREAEYAAEKALAAAQADADKRQLDAEGGEAMFTERVTQEREDWQREREEEERLRKHDEEQLVAAKKGSPRSPRVAPAPEAGLQFALGRSEEDIILGRSARVAPETLAGSPRENAASGRSPRVAPEPELAGTSDIR